MKSVTVSYDVNSLPVINIIFASHPISIPHERANEYPGFTVTSETLLHPDNLSDCVSEFANNLEITTMPCDITEAAARDAFKQVLLTGFFGSYQLRQVILESGFLKLDLTKPDGTAIKSRIHFCKMPVNDMLRISMTGFNENASITIRRDDLIICHRNQVAQKRYALTGSDRYTDQVWYLDSETTVD